MTRDRYRLERCQNQLVECFMFLKDRSDHCRPKPVSFRASFWRLSKKSTNHFVVACLVNNHCNCWWLGDQCLSENGSFLFLPLQMDGIKLLYPIQRHKTTYRLVGGHILDWMFSKLILLTAAEQSEQFRHHRSVEIWISLHDQGLCRVLLWEWRSNSVCFQPFHKNSSLFWANDLTALAYAAYCSGHTRWYFFRNKAHLWKTTAPKSLIMAWIQLFNGWKRAGNIWDGWMII